MLRLQKESQLLAPEVIERAVAFFGPEGWGMAPVEQTREGVHFIGGAGGHVTVEAVEKGDGGGTLVRAESDQWDDPMRTFLEAL